MCGIFCSIYRNIDAKLHVKGILSDCKDLLSNRGPDVQGCDHIKLSETHGVHLFGSTLHLRGRNPTIQPLSDKDGNMLLWNGEIFGGIRVEEDENDGKILLNLLSKCASDSRLLEIFGKINGPYSFIYWQASTSKLWFGRDALGRRSLLTMTDRNYLVLSSVSSESKEHWKEVPAAGIYCLQLGGTSLQNESNGCSFHIDLHPWLWMRDPNKDSKINSNWLDIDLFHVADSCFESVELSPVGIECSFRQLNQLQGEIEILPSVASEYELSDFATEIRKKAADQLLRLLCESVQKRTETSSLPRLCSACIEQHLQRKMPSPDSSTHLECDFHSREGAVRKCNHSKVAVLFSGGIDSLVVAAIADRYVAPDDPIDLLNVSFVDQYVCKNKDNQVAPDRLTGIQGWHELKATSPKRKWNFVEVNVSLEKLREKREQRIKHLIRPLDTVLDDSIGCAIWFAAQGIGRLRADDDGDDNNDSYDGVVGPYTSTARVILLGMGADELFAGYSRHRMRFTNQGWQGVAQELELEIKNISSRNLGRDDRILSDVSKEARFPYLDERLVDYILSLSLSTKFDLRLPRGIGEKLLLRLAAVMLGLSRGANLHKRAIQFGSRIAKLEGRKEKASHKCFRLQGGDS